jgi:hypothetical protein
LGAGIVEEQEPLHVTLQNLRHDLTSVRHLVELLYTSHFGSTPDGRERFATLSRTIMNGYEKATEGEGSAFEAGIMNSGASMLDILNSISARMRL